MTKTAPAPALDRERHDLLRRFQDWLETPMLILGFVWLGLLLWELIRGLNPLLEAAGIAIWIVFIVNFVIEIVLAPSKLDYLKHNWLSAISLVVPAFRVLRFARIFRALRAARGLRLVRVVGSLNRGMRALGASMGRRGFGYVIALTAVVTLIGAAGMFAFENDATIGGHLNTYGEALWWTAMIMTTMGSAYWPVTPEGRILCLVLALYAFTIFGYVTAALATYFVGRDADHDEAEIASARMLAELRQDVAALRESIDALRGADSVRR